LTTKTSENGLTLVELAVIVLLIGIFSTIVVTRFDAISGYRQNGELRAFLNTWQFLLNEAVADGNTYQLIIDITGNSYLVRQEIPLPPEDQGKVDLNKNLRLKSERERKQRKEDQQALTPDEAFRLIDEQENTKTLDELFALTVYADPGRNIVLSTPVNFPSLGEEQVFSGSIRINSISVDGNEISEGRVGLNFSPRGATNIAVVNFDIDGQHRAALLNPLSGESIMISGRIDANFVTQGVADDPQ
jgi:type II secretory pathway pseudopilin PulG